MFNYINKRAYGFRVPKPHNSYRARSNWKRALSAALYYRRKQKARRAFFLNLGRRTGGTASQRAGARASYTRRRQIRD